MQISHNDAKRKAKFGHRDWVVYRDKSGVEHGAPLSREIVKEAMLSVGCRGRFLILSASTGIGYIQNWSMGCLLIRNARYLNARAA